MKRLEMDFSNTDGSNFRLTVEDPKADLDGPVVKEAMNSIIQKDIFETKGFGLEKIKEARIVTITKENIELG